MKFYFFIAVISIAIMSCNQDGAGKYEKLKAKELASGRRVDSLFFGIYFGMTGKQFYEHCWEMNKKGLFTDGENNTAVLHRLTHDELRHPGLMNFYPEFKDNKINRMKVTFQYEAWAPWNKDRFSDSLMTDIKKLYNEWYKDGNPFIAITDEKKGTIYVKVDGNRRITIGRPDDMHIKVDYTDLLAEQTSKNK